MDESGIAVYLYTLNLPSLHFFSVWSSIVKPLRTDLTKMTQTLIPKQPHLVYFALSYRLEVLVRFPRRRSEMEGGRVVPRSSVEQIK